MKRISRSTRCMRKQHQHFMEMTKLQQKRQNRTTLAQQAIRSYRLQAKNAYASHKKFSQIQHQVIQPTVGNTSLKEPMPAFLQNIVRAYAKRKPLMNKIPKSEQEQEPSYYEEPVVERETPSQEQEQEQEQEQDSNQKKESNTTSIILKLLGLSIVLAGGVVAYLYSTDQLGTLKMLLGMDSDNPEDIKKLASKVNDLIDSLERDDGDYSITEGTVKFNAILDDITSDEAETAEEESNREEEAKPGFFGRIWETLGVAVRFMQMLMYFSPALFSYMFYDTNRFYVDLTNAFQRAGPCFIKFGQWIASRPDLFPKEMCEEMERFHREGIVHSMDDTRAAIEAAFDGKPLEEIFVEFDEKPVGSGSIAQVHAGVVAPGVIGNEEPLKVAVKVRHPNTGTIVSRDLKLLRYIIAGATTFMKCIGHEIDWMRMDENIVVFAESMRAQVDLRFEGRNLQQFSENFKDIKNISFPKPYYWKSDILVEEFIEGEIISTILKNPTSDLKVQAGALGTHTFLKMMVTDNFMHGDMHPGNIMVREKVDEETGEKFTNLVLIDAGLIVQLTKSNRIDFIKLFTSFVCDNAHDTAMYFIDGKFRRRYENGELTEMESQRFNDFIGGISGLISQVNHTNKGAHKIGSACQNLLELGNRLQIPLESNFTTLLVASIVVEGVGRQLDPQLPFLETARAMLVHKSFSEASNYFTSSFKKLKTSSSVF